MKHEFEIPLDREQIRTVYGDDPFLHNFYLNLFEYKTAQITLESYPWHLAMPIADICNAQCTFCNAWLYGRGVLTPDQLDRFTPLLPYARDIGLHGHGEPLVNPHLDEILARMSTFRDPRSRAFVITNGIFLDEKFELLRKHNVTTYNISLNAASPETHETVMHLGSAAFPRIVDAIRAITQRRTRSDPDLYVTASLVLTRDNLHEAAAFVRLCEELHLDQAIIRTLNPMDALIEGLNYHRLPPYLHPRFAEHVAALRQAVDGAYIDVRCSPDSWAVPTFPPPLQETIRLRPPADVSRAQALRDKELRQYNALHYASESGSGQPLVTVSPTERTRLASETNFDGNALERIAPMKCGYAYHYFVANHLNWRVGPCCYFTSVPGFEPVVFDGSRDFMEYWNSPAYQALRRRLREGPLYRMCATCPDQGRRDV